jgi:hypothetical protein
MQIGLRIFSQVFRRIRAVLSADVIERLLVYSRIVSEH